MKSPLPSIFSRLIGGKRQQSFQRARKSQVGNLLVWGIGGATAGGILWQCQDKDWKQVGDLLLQVQDITLDEDYDQLQDPRRINYTKHCRKWETFGVLGT